MSSADEFSSARLPPAVPTEAPMRRIGLAARVGFASQVTFVTTGTVLWILAIVLVSVGIIVALRFMTRHGTAAMYDDVSACPPNDR